MDEVTRIVYCDMDGVLSDLEYHFNELFGLDTSNYVSDAEFWRHINGYGRAKFFYGMPWMPGGKDLWEYINKHFLKVKICTALGSSDAKDGQTTKGKRAWLHKHIPSLHDSDIIMVANRHEKKRYSTPNDIIIDDTPIVIEEWIQQGGIGILHKNLNTTLKQLENYV